MLREICGWSLAFVGIYAIFPVLKGCLEILLSPRKDLVLLLVVSFGVALELRRCLRFLE